MSRWPRVAAVNIGSSWRLKLSQRSGFQARTVIAMVWAPVLLRLCSFPQVPSHPFPGLQALFGPGKPLSLAGASLEAWGGKLSGGNLVWAELECCGGRLPGEPQGQRVGGGRKTSDTGPIMDAWQPAGRRREAEPATERTERRRGQVGAGETAGPRAPVLSGSPGLAPAAENTHGHTVPPPPRAARPAALSGARRPPRSPPQLVNLSACTAAVVVCPPPKAASAPLPSIKIEPPMAGIHLPCVPSRRLGPPTPEKSDHWRLLTTFPPRALLLRLKFFSGTEVSVHIFLHISTQVLPFSLFTRVNLEGRFSFPISFPPPVSHPLPLPLSPSLLNLYSLALHFFCFWNLLR